MNLGWPNQLLNNPTRSNNIVPTTMQLCHLLTQIISHGKYIRRERASPDTNENICRDRSEEVDYRCYLFHYSVRFRRECLSWQQIIITMIEIVIDCKTYLFGCRCSGFKYGCAAPKQTVISCIYISVILFSIMKSLK
jgi:hypothetical protein